MPLSDPWLAIATCLALGYLLGSIPFGLLLTRAAGLGDIRAIGSGNIGATNVLRTGNRKLAAATLLLDVLKGTAAVLLVPWLVEKFLIGDAPGTVFQDGAAAWIPALPLAAAGLGAFLGHCFPVWLGFKGGKGVATYIGILAGWLWPAALAFCAIWLATAAATRYSSLSALVAASITPAVVYGLESPWPLTIGACLLSAILVLKHHANIKRLMAGTESKIGAKG